jgi:hypothetical protein
MDFAAAAAPAALVPGVKDTQCVVFLDATVVELTDVQHELFFEALTLRGNWLVHTPSPKSEFSYRRSMRPI